MKTYQYTENKRFIGRIKERIKLEQFSLLKNSAILVLYGRRRVGKTELIEQTLGKRHLLKFEGLENQPQSEQIKHVLYQLSRYTGESYLTHLNFKDWAPVLDLIADKIEQGEWTLYFEELQWLANYENKFISALKYVWDNRLRHNPTLRMVLCGSSPSFMINEVIHSRALYNRSQQEMCLQPFTLDETRLFLPKLSHHDIVLAHLTVGGVPEYLKYFRNEPSTFIGICNNAFKKDSFLSHEYQRIFISSLSDNPHYKAIVNYLSQKKFATRQEITKQLEIESGGSLSNVLADLEQCGFIEKYQPYFSKSTKGLVRYCIKDPYLMFYGKFIAPILKNIDAGQYDDNPTHAINQKSYHVWMGYAFERFIRHQQFVIAKILGFSGLPYQWGVYYNRKTIEKEPGYQIDLLYEHSKHVYTICEIKYYADFVGTSVISEMEKKIALFANDKNYTIQKILITNLGATQELIARAYFDRIVTIDDLFSKSQNE